MTLDTSGDEIFSHDLGLKGVGDQGGVCSAKATS